MDRNRGFSLISIIISMVIISIIFVNYATKVVNDKDNKNADLQKVESMLPSLAQQKTSLPKLQELQGNLDSYNRAFYNKVMLAADPNHAIIKENGQEVVINFGAIDSSAIGLLRIKWREPIDKWGVCLDANEDLIFSIRTDNAINFPIYNKDELPKECLGVIKECYLEYQIPKGKGETPQYIIHSSEC